MIGIEVNDDKMIDYHIFNVYKNEINVWMLFKHRVVEAHMAHQRKVHTQLDLGIRCVNWHLYSFVISIIDRLCIQQHALALVWSINCILLLMYK